MNRKYFVYTFIVTFLLNYCYSQNADTTKIFHPEDSSRIKIHRLDINSSYSDFSPILLKKTMMFASGRPGMVVVSYANENKTEITDLYYATKQDSVNFSKVRPFSKNINTKFNEASFTLYHNGDTIFFTGNAKPDKKNGQSSNKLQIYKSKKINNEWTIPEVASFCDPANSNCHPAISQNDQLMVFCSDMPGGYGGTDIYYVKFENNEWSKPVNFGSKVNGEGNELFPYIFANSTLYFSSNRVNGLGGLDIYSFDLSDQMRGEVTLLSHPLNSSFDDFGICLDSAGKSGYFTSNRKVSTGDDIYHFSVGYPDFSKSPGPPVKNKFCYSFFEENGYQSNDSVSMIYEWDFGDGQKIREDRCKHCFTKPGNYLIQLNVVEKSSGEVFFNQVSYTLTVEEPPQLIINCKDTVVAGTEIIIDAEKSAVKGYQLIGFYWLFGDGRYNTGPFVKHRFKKAGIHKIELGVTAKNEQTQLIEKFKIEKNIFVKESI